jgi:hypothetical protein
MSISSLDTSNQTGLVPNTLLGYSSDGVNAIQITPTALTLAGNLTTSPIYATISQSGLSTTNPTGFDIISKLNMNSNNIDNVGTITATSFAGTSTNATNCSTTATSTAGTYFPVFVSNNTTGNYPNLVGTMTYNPSTNAITANTFNGNATKLNTTADNSATTSYLLFSQGTAGTGKTIYQDDTTTPLTYTPSTSTLTASIFNGLCSTGGLVYLSTGSQSITGSASATNITMSSIFNSTYQNYRIVLYPTTQVSFSAYPTYNLTGFLGTGTLPTVASLYGFEISSASSAIVSPVYTAGATISSAPLIFAVSQLVNHHTIIEVENVGYTATATQSIGLKCKSFYGNPGVSGASDRSISATNISGSTITGLTLQQSSISAPNNMTIGWTIYAYK